jgi:hypothetical protein
LNDKICALLKNPKSFNTNFIPRINLKIKQKEGFHFDHKNHFKFQQIMLEKATAHGLDIKSSAFECFRPKS